VRILLINPNTSANITDAIAERARLVAGPSVEFVPVTGAFGAPYIATRAAVVIAAHAALQALTQNVRDCDAIYLACFGDPGLLALREQSPVPVVGMAEASIREACQIGGRFAIVTGGLAWKPMLLEYVACLGLSDRLASVRAIAPTGDQIARDAGAAITELAAAGNDCAKVDGADVVILGGAGLAGLAEQIQERVPVPVLCSMTVGTRAVVEAARSSRRTTSASTSTATF
jgi:allantoin racemase